MDSPDKLGNEGKSCTTLTQMIGEEDNKWAETYKMAETYKKKRSP